MTKRLSYSSFKAYKICKDKKKDGRSTVLLLLLSPLLFCRGILRNILTLCIDFPFQKRQFSPRTMKAWKIINIPHTKKLILWSLETSFNSPLGPWKAEWGRGDQCIVFPWVCKSVISPFLQIIYIKSYHQSVKLSGKSGAWIFNVSSTGVTSFNQIIPLFKNLYILVPWYWLQCESNLENRN